MSEPVWIEDELALAIHDRQLVEHGGAEGLRDEALLQSALARPLSHFAHESSDIVELAAKYTAGIVQNHPFVDGNKRTGFVVGVLFLELNGYRFTASEEAAAQAVLDLAAGRMDERGFCEFLRANSKRI
ncbi:MAG: type II toxin-antitoxin system death-on-curing family toxin [Steroidobacteraceae bacterium]|jgi:death-on-curing protein